MWEDWTTAKRGLYTYARIPNHPKANKSGYVYEHRVVMENKINRLLKPNEVVHHINGNGKDNREENLELTNFSDHSREHSTGKGVGTINITCDQCNKRFERAYNQRKESKGARNQFCSRQCLYNFQRDSERDFGKCSERVLNNKFLCNMCLKYYNKDKFHNNKSKKYGISRACKTCFNSKYQKR